MQNWSSHSSGQGLRSPWIKTSTLSFCAYMGKSIAPPLPWPHRLGAPLAACQLASRATPTLNCPDTIGNRIILLVFAVLMAFLGLVGLDFSISITGTARPFFRGDK